MTLADYEVSRRLMVAALIDLSNYKEPHRGDTASSKVLRTSAQRAQA